MTPVIAYIGVGSNIEPEHNIPRALMLLSKEARMRGVSSWYRTAPVGGRNQQDFLNGVVCVETVVRARRLKYELLRGIEAAMGRVRTEDKYAPRCIDFDLLLYGDELINEPGLHIPDPDIRQRAFVALPLLEVAPELVLPDTREPLAQCPMACENQGLNLDAALTTTIRNLLNL